MRREPCLQFGRNSRQSSQQPTLLLNQLTQLTLGADPLGDIPGAADRAGDVAGHVERDLPEPFEPVRGPVGPDHVVLHNVGSAVCEGLVQVGQDGRAFVGMKQLHPHVERAVERSGRQPEQRLQARIHRGHAGGLVPLPRAESACLQRELQPSLAVFDDGRPKVLGCDVFGDADDRDDVAVTVDERAVRCPHPQMCSVLTAKDEVAGPALTGRQPGHDVACNLEVLRPHQQTHQARADQFASRVAVQLLRGGVRVDDRALKIADNDGLGDRLEDAEGRHQVRLGQRPSLPREVLASCQHHPVSSIVDRGERLRMTRKSPRWRSRAVREPVERGSSRRSRRPIARSDPFDRSQHV